MHAQLFQQLLQAGGAYHQLYLGFADDRAQEVFLEVAREGGHGADAQALHTLQFAAFRERQQFAAQVEYALRVLQHQVAYLGQPQRATVAAEQFVAELFLQLLDL